MSRLFRLLPVIFMLLSMTSLAQLSDKEKLTEALYLIDENRFAAAQPYLLELHEKDEKNANINFNLGLTYLKSFNEKEKEKALPYLKLASENVSPNYSPFDPREKKAPVDALYYLALTQHNDYQFIEARDNLLKFRKFINEKHYLWKDVSKQLKMAEYAQKAVTNPVNIETTNLGDLLNGFYPDFSPVVRIDETAIYFTSRRLRKDSSNYEIYDPIDGMMYEDLYVSFKNEKTDVWEEPMPLNINTEGHEATVNLSIDGRTLYIYKDINGNGELFESKLLADSAGIEEWSDPKKLGSNINTKAYETHVTVTPDGKELYFISDREGGLGGKDIYKCKRLPTGDWALAQNAGPILNSEFDEDGVFMHPDGKTLYFSSNGHESMGGYDIMYAVNTDSGWTSPKNMGYPINSVDDDVFFVTTPDGKRAYFSSFKEEGYGEKDVYMLQLLDAEESAITLYRGEFTFIDRFVPPSGALVTIINNNTGELVGYYTPRSRDGQFSAILETNTSYHFTYESDGYETYEEDIYVPSGANYQEIYKEIKLRPVRVGDEMGTIETTPLDLANVKGQLAKDGDPMPGIKILLMNEDKELLEQTETDDVGVFNFTKLDPTNTYLIEIIAEEELRPVLGYTIDVENDKGELLTFEQIDKNTYIFVPTLQPYEYYGIRAKEIKGQVKTAGDPLVGLSVKLENEEKELIQQETTDQYGEFNFQKLDLDQKYRITFEGDFPDDSEILLYNEKQEKLEFRKIAEGIYEYVPVAAPKLKLVDIDGAVTSNDEPVVDLGVLLQNEDRILIKRTATDSVGNFNFINLDLKQIYFIEFEGDFPEDIKLVVANADYDLLLFRKIDRGLYKYDPVFVKLEDANANLMQREITDDVNEFNYQRLDTDNYYKITYEGNFPDDDFIELTNHNGEVLKFMKVKEGVYEYVPPVSPKVDSTKTDGQIMVKLEDKDANLMQREITDNVEEFNYQKLNPDEYYKITYEGDYPDDDFIELKNHSGEVLKFMKVKEGVYEYIPPATLSVVKGSLPNTYARVEDENRKLIERFRTEDFRQFKFRKLNLDKEFWIVFEDKVIDDVELVVSSEIRQQVSLIQESDSEFHYVPPVKVKSYTMDIEDRPDLKETYPRPAELRNVIAYFQRYFIYNAKDINKQNKDFVAFINDIAELVEIRGYVDIIITSSASKVPTKTWKTNSILTKKRAYDTKALLEQIFKERGIKPDQYNFVDINTLITGPEYKGDWDTNVREYEKYQYVRIFVK